MLYTNPAQEINNESDPDEYHHTQEKEEEEEDTSKRIQKKDCESDVTVKRYDTLPYVCRVCTYSSPRNNLVALCNCKEFNRYAHIRCINSQRAKSLFPGDYYRCRMCKSNYKLKRIFKTHIHRMKWIRFLLMFAWDITLTGFIVYLLLSITSFFLMFIDTKRDIVTLFNVGYYMSYMMASFIAFLVLIGIISTLLYGSMIIRQSSHHLCHNSYHIHHYNCGNNTERDENRIKICAMILCIFFGIIGMGIFIYAIYMFIRDCFERRYHILGRKFLDVDETVEDVEQITDWNNSITV